MPTHCLNLVVVVLVFGLGQLTLAQQISQKAVYNEYLIKFKKGGKIAGNFSIRSDYGHGDLLHIKISSSDELRKLRENPEIEFIEPNYILSAGPVEAFEKASAPGGSESYSQSETSAQVSEAWAIEKSASDSKIIVAVIDTGLDAAHPLFRDSGAIWENLQEKNGQPGVDDDKNGYVDDTSGWNFYGRSGNAFDDNDHGSHVAGIILGVGQDLFAIPVRNSKIQIMPLKFLNSLGQGSTSNAIAAIYYAVRNGAKVINNSWAGSTYSQALETAYIFAADNHVVIVSAAGNSGRDNDVTGIFPANIQSKNNISVMAVTPLDSIAWFSNFGFEKVDVAAPGVEILSTVPGICSGELGCFEKMSGTSMAAPFVAGMVALMIREAEQLPPEDLKNFLLRESDPSESLKDKLRSGGTVNVLRAVTAAKNWSLQNLTAPASLNFPQDSGAGQAGCGRIQIVHSEKNPVSGVNSFFGMLFLLPVVLAFRFRNRRFNYLFC